MEFLKAICKGVGVIALIWTLLNLMMRGLGFEISLLGYIVILITLNLAIFSLVMAMEQDDHFLRFLLVVVLVIPLFALNMGLMFVFYPALAMIIKVLAILSIVAKYRIRRYCSLNIYNNNYY